MHSNDAFMKKISNSDQTISPPEFNSTRLLGTTLASSALAACGGGGDSQDGAASVVSSSAESSPKVKALAASTPNFTGIGCTDIEASRFLAQASMGATRNQIARIKVIGFSAWLDEQMDPLKTPQTSSRWDWINQINWNGSKPRYQLESIYWRKLMASPDTLRQRITLALSEILVVSFAGLDTAYFGDVSCYLDLLEKEAFGNYRNLLGQISTSNAMGGYLSFVNNVKSAGPNSPQPDENYARELLQLFTIGLVKLNQDGSSQNDASGQPIESYNQSDITQLARIFTGWVRDNNAGGSGAALMASSPRKMIANAASHDFGSITFLGSTVSGGATVLDRLNKTLDIIFAHPNVAPFISKQLIQRLVTSNPSAKYISAVAAIFNNDGTGVKGNLRAVVKAILLHDEARNPSFTVNNFSGKLREPILRLTAWARAYTDTSTAFTTPAGGTPSAPILDRWEIAPLDSPATGLGQQQMRSPTVFNFFRPTYSLKNSSQVAIPANMVINGALVAPEFQITNETSIAGYSNFSYWFTTSGFNNLPCDYSSLLPLADDANSLLNEINVVLCAGQLSAATLNTLSAAINTMSKGSIQARGLRAGIAVFMAMQTPDFLIVK